MPRVDYERAFGQLRDQLLEKRSWGMQAILLLMAELERDCTVERTDREQFVRLFGDDLEEAFRRTTSSTAATPPLTHAPAAHGRATVMQEAPRHPHSATDGRRTDEHHSQPGSPGLHAA